MENMDAYGQPDVQSLVKRMNALGDFMSLSRKTELYGWLQAPSPEILSRVEHEISAAEAQKMTAEYRRGQREGTRAILGRALAAVVMLLIGEGFLALQYSKGMDVFIAIGIGFLYFAVCLVFFAYSCIPVLDLLLKEGKNHESDRKVGGLEMPSTKPPFPGYEKPKK